MNILLFGEVPGARGVLNQILEKSRHRLVQQTWEDMPEPDLEKYDMVLVDGNVCDCAHQARLLQWVSTARSRYPNLPVVAMNCLGTPAPAENARPATASHSCGITESANGVWLTHCRLKELALSETAALLRDVCERPSLEPVVFEYSGQG